MSLHDFTDSRHIDKDKSYDVVIFRSISLVNEQKCRIIVQGN